MNTICARPEILDYATKKLYSSKITSCLLFNLNKWAKVKRGLELHVGGS